MDTTPLLVQRALLGKQAEAITVAGADYSAIARPRMGRPVKHSGPALVPPTQLGH